MSKAILLVVGVLAVFVAGNWVAAHGSMGPGGNAGMHARNATSPDFVTYRDICKEQRCPCVDVYNTQCVGGIVCQLEISLGSTVWIACSDLTSEFISFIGGVKNINSCLACSSYVSG